MIWPILKNSICKSRNWEVDKMKFLKIYEKFQQSFMIIYEVFIENKACIISNWKFSFKLKSSQEDFSILCMKKISWVLNEQTSIIFMAFKFRRKFVMNEVDTFLHHPPLIQYIFSTFKEEKSVLELLRARKERVP